VAGTEEAVESEMLRIADEQAPDQQQNSLRTQTNKQAATVLTANGRIAAATYRITLAQARRIFPILHNRPVDAPEIAASHPAIQVPPNKNKTSLSTTKRTVKHVN